MEETEETGKGSHDIIVIQKQIFDDVLQQAAEEITRIIHENQAYHLKTAEAQKSIDNLVTDIFDVWTGAYHRIVQTSQEDRAMLTEIVPVRRKSFFGRRDEPSAPRSSQRYQEPERHYDQRPVARERPPKTPWYETTRRVEPRPATAQTPMREDPIDDEQREFEEFQNWKRGQSRNGQNRIPYNKK